MKKVSVTLNGKKVEGHAGETILELAQKNGVAIPTLCYAQKLSPIGACRVCVVEVEGAKSLVGSCHTPVQEGMAIQTDSPKVQQARRVIVELMLSSHAGDCLVCDNANTCELRKLAADLGVAVSRFGQKRRFYALEDSCPWMFRDLTKCVQCWRCIWACRELAGKDLLSCGYRGLANKVVSDTDEPLCKEACRVCEECIAVCPTGAINRPAQRFKKRKGKPLIINEN